MNNLFELADKLRELREEKTVQEKKLEDIKAEIKNTVSALSDAMVESECSNFNRGDKKFVLTTTTYYSPETDRKEDLYAALKANGHEHLFSVNSKTLSSFVKGEIESTMDDNGETHVPEWLSGLVKSYDEVGITMRKA